MLLSLASLSVVAATIQGVRIHESPDATRIVLDTSGAVKQCYFNLDKPHRVVIDVSNARAAEDEPCSGGKGPKAHKTSSEARRAEKAIGWWSTTKTRRMLLRLNPPALRAPIAIDLSAAKKTASTRKRKPNHGQTIVMS
ncbi:MAG: hypothetical protein CM15mP120_06080 [Pseudomonadota bacterium]|nr:MAG: hypothetical protein CM15mP120_06080 [Pseudomonadota bacterium]